MHHVTHSRSPHKALHSPSWGERSEPHTCGENGKLSIYLLIYIYIWYVRIPYMHSALFVRDAIFPHCILGSCITACSRDKTRKASRTERLNSGNQRNRDLKKARKGGTTSKTEADY